MCVGDWRIGRFIKTVTRQVTLGATSTVVIPANRQRVGIWISANFVDTIATPTWEIQIDGVTIAVSVNVPSVFKATLVHDGDMPTKQFSLVNPSANPMTPQITEFFLPEEFLDKGTEQWKRELMG